MPQASPLLDNLLVRDLEVVPLTQTLAVSQLLKQSVRDPMVLLRLRIKVSLKLLHLSLKLFNPGIELRFIRLVC